MAVADRNAFLKIALFSIVVLCGTTGITLGAEPNREPPAGPPAADSATPPPADGKVADAPKGKRLEPIPDPKYLGPAEIEVTAFHGVTPGVTTRDGVAKAWGKPKDERTQEGTLTQLYAVDPFPRVEVTYSGDKVASLVIRFERGFPASQVAQLLDLVKVQPVLVPNEYGEVLGQAYPERGVLFSFEASQEAGKTLKKVTHIVLEPINPEPFVLRAEMNLELRPEFSLHDLDEAIKMKPGNAQAHWLRCRALILLGQYERALASATEAVRLDPKDPRYQLAKAQATAQAGHLQEAMPEAEKAVELSQKRPHVLARALCLIGDLKASSPRADFKEALQYHAQALRTAEPLTSARQQAVRMAAKEVYIDAHLGAAHDIAWGEWREKEPSVDRWLNKAAALVDEFIKTEDAGEQYRFRLAVRALETQVGLQGHLDPSRWVAMTVQSGDAMISSTPDPARKAQLQWDLAMALYDALQIYQLRADHQSALKYGEMAIAYLERSGRQTQSPAVTYLLGRLYFRMGAINAVIRDDHATAVTWFDKAGPLLRREPPPEALPELGGLGDTFVCMGISYWKTGHRDTAIRMTEFGAKLLEEAVHRGISTRGTLAVPYTNLALMHREMGDQENANRLQEMAAKAKTTTIR
jgi:tetratricopeptide (TPR) repeat protein